MSDRSGEIERKVTIIDIAKRAGVSQGTVAHVLSGAGKSSIRVGQATRERVLSIARELNYQPNLAGRILRGKGSRIIGVLIDSQAPQSTYRILTHIQQLASEKEYRIMVIQAHDSMTNFMEVCQILEQYGTDGIIALSHDYPGLSLPKSFFENNRRIVYVGEPSFSAPYVVRIDRSTGIHECLERLIAKGRRKPGMAIFEGESLDLRQRCKYFSEQVQLCWRHDCVSLLKVPLTRPEDNAVVIADWVLEEKLDSVLLPDDFHGVALVSELHRRGIRVPEDVSVIGCDDERFANLTIPRLTSISEDAKGQAEAAMRTFMNMLVGEDSGNETVRTHLVMRESL